MGTLALWLDKLGPNDPPLLAMPINLNVLLRLPENQAYMGFTASTGKAWEKHDVTEWYFCETPGCAILRGGGRGERLGDAAYADDAVDANATDSTWLRFYV